MDDERKRSQRLRSFMYGVALGSSAALAAARRRRRRPKRESPAGLAAFEAAPCYRETLEREQARER